MVQELKLNHQRADGTIFVPHGAYGARYDNGLIIDEAAGPFNLEMIQLYIKHSEPFYTAAAEHGPFASLTIFRTSMMFTQEAWTLFDQYVRALRSQHRASSVLSHVAGADVEGRDLISRKFARLHRELATPYQLFPDVEEGERWARAELEKLR